MKARRCGASGTGPTRASCRHNSLEAITQPPPTFLGIGVKERVPFLQLSASPLELYFVPWSCPAGEASPSGGLAAFQHFPPTDLRRGLTPLGRGPVRRPLSTGPFAIDLLPSRSSSYWVTRPVSVHAYAFVRQFTAPLLKYQQEQTAIHQQTQFIN